VNLIDKVTDENPADH